MSFDDEETSFAPSEFQRNRICNRVFYSIDHIVSHLQHEHVGLTESALHVCLWKDCTRKGKIFKACQLECFLPFPTVPFGDFLLLKISRSLLLQS